jgi:hypothetical protein
MILTDDECREIYNNAMAMPERSVVSAMRVIEAAVLAKLGAEFQIVTVERALEMAELAGIEHINHIKYRGRFNRCTVPEKHEMRCLTDLVNIASKVAYAAGAAARLGADNAAISGAKHPID